MVTRNISETCERPGDTKVKLRDIESWIDVVIYWCISLSHLSLRK